MESKPSYYAIIPATVRYDKRISASAKLLYGEITALCSKEGYCWATNKYFKDLYNVNKTTVLRWMAELIEAGYIKSESSPNRRKIFMSESFVGLQKCDPRVSKMQPQGGENATPINVSITHSTTSSNNRSQENPLTISTGNLLIKLPLPGTGEVEIRDSLMPLWKESYPKVDIKQALSRMKLWLRSNPSRRKTIRGIERFINTWLSREQNNPGYTEITSEGRQFGIYYLEKYENFKDKERQSAWINTNKFAINNLFKISGNLQVAKGALDIAAGLKSKLGYRWTITDRSILAMWPECVVKAEYQIREQA